MIVVDDAFSSRVIGADVELLVDPTASMSVTDALASPDWTASTKPTPNYGFTHAAVWARFVVRDSRRDSTPLRFELAYAPLDRIEVHALRAGPTSVGGDTLAFSERSYPYRFVTFPFSSSPERTTTYLVRLSGQSSLQVALVLYAPAAFERALRGRTPLARAVDRPARVQRPHQARAHRRGAPGGDAAGLSRGADLTAVIAGVAARRGARDTIRGCHARPIRPTARCRLRVPCGAKA